MDTVFVTPDGLRKMQQELETLHAQRPIIAQRIGEAKEQGDLSENAEYQSARDEQSILESKIVELEEQIKNVQVVTHKETDTDTVSIGSSVDVECKKDGHVEKRTFHIVGANEADPAEGKIPNDSPVAAALIGKKKNTSVSVETPTGAVSYTIKKIA